MDKKFTEIVKDYLSKAEDAKNLILRGLGVSSRDKLREFRGRMPMGTFYLDGMKHDFAFHGRGCRFTNEYYNVPVSERKNKCLNIDMDMGYNGDIWCGIDPWKLFCFIEEYYAAYKKQFNIETIKNELELGIKENIMYKKYDLYYFH